MGEYRVDPDGVLGVLAGLDDLEPEFEKAHRDIDTAASEGPSSLTVDGRKVLARAWETFMEQRQRVPGKVMHVINISAQAVSNATLEVVTGDEQMAIDIASAESYAENVWGIPPQDAYLTNGATP